MQRILDISENKHNYDQSDKQKEIIHQITIYEKMIHEFNEMIKDRDVLIVGIDFLGMMIATKLAIVSQKPFTYAIPKKNEKYFSDHDKKIKICNKNIIIVTDVIVTGETVNNVIDELKYIYGVDQDRIEKILTVFRRQATSNSSKKPKIENHLSEFEDKIISLNNEIYIELCFKKKCIFKENNICICESRRI